MRISGTLLERLLIRIIPVAILIGAVFYFTVATELSDFLRKMALVTLMIWIFDCLLLMGKRIKRLSIVGDKLRIADDIIKPGDLLSVRQKRDKRIGTTINTVEIEYLKNGYLARAQIITKPTFGDIFGRKTKTIEILVDEFPELKKRVLWKM